MMRVGDAIDDVVDQVDGAGSGTEEREAGEHAQLRGPLEELAGEDDSASTNTFLLH